MQVDAVIERLKEQVLGLHKRVSGAGDFAALLRSGQPSAAPVQAHVLYAGLVGIGKPDVATGAYRQPVTSGINVMLSIRSNDAAGQKALDEVETLSSAIMNALCGWAPGDEVGVFQLVRSGLVSFEKGMMRWQIDFVISDQVRIIPV